MGSAAGGACSEQTSMAAPSDCSPLSPGAPAHTCREAVGVAGLREAEG